MSQKEDEGLHVKRGADLMRQGAALIELACPACASPLFRLRNRDLWCAKCQRKVIIVKEGEDPSRITSPIVLGTLEATLLAKVDEIQNRMKHENDVEELQKLGKALSGLLENLEKTRKATGA